MAPRTIFPENVNPPQRGAWTPAIPGYFAFNAIIKATVNGEARIYKVDPKMIVEPG